MTDFEHPLAAWRVSPGTRGDLPHLVRIAGESFEDPWSERLFAAEFDVAGARVWVARLARLVRVARPDPSAASDVAGYLVTRRVGDEVHVLSLAVARRERRRGGARALLETALRAELASGARVARLEVRADNAGALALYERLGFRIDGRRPRYYAGGEDALLLSGAP